MSGQTTEKNKRRDQMKGTRPKREQLDWGRRVAKASKIDFDEDEYLDMLDGEQDALDEMAQDDHEDRGRRQDEDEAHDEFARLDEECRRIELLLVGLVGKKGEPTYPKGATSAQRKTIDEATEPVWDALERTEPEEAGKQLELLRGVVSKVEEALEKEKKALTGNLETLAKIFRLMKKLTSEEWGTLNKAVRETGVTIKDSDLETARSALERLRQLIDQVTTDERPETLLARLEELANKGNDVPTTRAIYLDCINAGVKVEGLQLRSKLRSMGVLPSEFTSTPNYTIDSKGGDRHAYERHTREGIWEVGALWTAHPSKVAIFPSLGALDTAISRAPTLKTAWKETGSGRYDADLGGVHYQGVSLGNTLALFSCYPIDSKTDYPKAAVALLLSDMLREGASFEEFCDELTKL